MPGRFSDSELAAYLDEALPPDEMARVESAVRADGQLLQRLSQVNQARDRGQHTLAEIWRRHRLSCPTRQQLGAYLLDVLDAELASYIFFHVTDVGCRYCLANLDDLRAEQLKTDTERSQRRQRYFQSSAGLLK
jgi:anti-sigma factor RsiW